MPHSSCNSPSSKLEFGKSSKKTYGKARECTLGLLFAKARCSTRAVTPRARSLDLKSSNKNLLESAEMDPRAPSFGNLECFDGLDAWMGVSPYSSSNCHSPNSRKLKSPCSSLSNFFEKLAHASSAAFRAGSRGQTFSAQGCCLECLLEGLVHRLTRSVHLRELGVLLHHSCLGSTCPP